MSEPGDVSADSLRKIFVPPGERSPGDLSHGKEPWNLSPRIGKGPWNRSPWIDQEVRNMDIQYLLFLQNIRIATGGVFDEFFNAISKFAVDLMPFLPFIIFWCVSKKWGTAT